MDNKVTATIDISRPAGRKLVRELERKRTVKLAYPATEEVVAAIAEGKVYTHEKVWGNITGLICVSW